MGVDPFFLGRAPLVSKSSKDESDKAEPPSRWEGPLLLPDLGAGGGWLWVVVVGCRVNYPL